MRGRVTEPSAEGLGSPLTGGEPRDLRERAGDLLSWPRAPWQSLARETRLTHPSMIPRVACRSPALSYCTWHDHVVDVPSPNGKYCAGRWHCL